ncbi:MAG: GTP-binding protein [Actinomycetota bacterium]|nr:GTP-binding protein [Actinomycetota bacterium]
MDAHPPTGIPLTVIGGFLGVGKTTLLNRLLTEAHDRRLAVLVNDFGAINIDAELVQERHGDTIDLTNGCVCCGVSGELMFALAGLRDRDDPPEHVIVEASGVGDPAAIAAYGDFPGFARDACVVLADAETVRARASDGTIGRQLVEQLRAADLVVLNKTDLVSAEELAQTRGWLRETLPMAGIVEATFGDVPADFLLGPHEASPPRGAPAATHEEHEHEREHGHQHRDAHPEFASWSWAGDAALNGTALCQDLIALPEGVLRAKGFLHLREDPEHRYLLQLVGRRWNIKLDRPWNEDVAGSRIVVIGLSPAIRPDELDATLARLSAPG